MLRLLQQGSGLRLAVCWMLTPDDMTTDGSKTSYLNDRRSWRHFDVELFDSLLQVVPLERHLRHVEERALLGEAILIEDLVPDNGTHRLEYERAVLAQLGASELVFFDPDNGIEVSSCPPGKKGSSKYLTWRELTATYATGRSVLVYQHFPRKPRVAFIAEMSDKLAHATEAARTICFRTANVGFFLVCQPAHEGVLVRAAERVAAAWSGEITYQ